MVICVIGGGAAGMTAALFAAENPNNQVILLERQTRVGRKLLATGNGRCNLTNRNFGMEHYHGADKFFAENALQSFDPSAVLAWFQELGLLTVAQENGRVYPYSDQANSVVDILRLHLQKPNLELRTGFEVQKLKKTETGFQISDAETVICADRVIVACGGLAGSNLGGSMSGYKLLAKLGHRATRLRPALVQLKSSWGGLSALKGVRANCSVKILHDEKTFAESAGELQFTEYGLSGPVIFEVSRDVCAGAGSWECLLDFLPEYSYDQLLSMLQNRTKGVLPAQELLTGIVHNRLGRVLTQTAGISLSKQCAQLPQAELSEVCRVVKALSVPLTEPMGMDHAQVTAGGVITDQFDPATMESRIVRGLYACGEVLDVDGDCGGYNLQWAWSSGRLAGVSAGKDSQ